MKEHNIYIYGILEESGLKNFDVIGVGKNKVYTINHQDLAAVVSNIKGMEIDPTRKNLLAHTQVQELLLKEYTLIPMSFGVITQSTETITKMLEENYLNFKQELKRLSEKIEIELKVYWNKEAIKEEMQSDHKYKQISNKIAKASCQEVKQDLLIEIGQMVEALVLKWKNEIGKDVYDNLASLAVDACTNKSNEITNILNASFLVSKSVENEFRDKVYSLDAKYQNKVDIKYIGPLPPYNFLQVELKGEQ